MTADDRRALAAGLPDDLLLVLIGARALWWETNGGTARGDVSGALSAPLPAGWWQDEVLARAVTHPAAPAWDGIFIAAMRRALG